MTPAGLEQKLKWGEPEHRRIVDALRARLRMSEQRMKDRYAIMARNEEIFQAYIPESDNDALRRRQRQVAGVPSYRTIEIPYSYGILMTAHTYYTSVFLGRNPVFQLSGRHGETEQNTQAIESVLDYQLNVGEWLVPLFIWLLDPGKYGFGVLGHYWDSEVIRSRSVVEEPVTFLGLPMPGMKARRVEKVQDIPGYRGNKIYNVRPQDWFPDPRKPMRYFQQGEFCARYVENAWHDVVAGEKSRKYFNIATLRKMRADRDGQLGAGMTISRDQGSSHVTQIPDFTRQEDFDQVVPPGFVKSYELYVRLVPKEWGFGTDDVPEIWVFTVSSNGVLYGVEPLGEYSGKFPFDVIEHEPEGYSMFSRSMLEISQPMADIITWLVNSHFYNVRQTLNNQFIVDPSQLVMKDVENPNPGKVIRLKPVAYGKDVRTMIQQLQVNDVTAHHFNDISMVGDFIQKTLGINESLMGAMPQKSHTTATAVRTSTNFGVNRMKTNCEYYSAMGFGPFTQKIVQRTQQYMDFQSYFRIAGDLAQFGQKPFVEVGPDLIAGFYDYVPVDGTLPIDRFAQANLWQMMLGQIQKYPQIMMQYDVAKIFAWVAGLAGIKNMAQFKLVPDGLMAQQAQAGNVVPIGAAMKDTKIGTNLNEPGQVPGLGATG